MRYGNVVSDKCTEAFSNTIVTLLDTLSYIEPTKKGFFKKTVEFFKRMLPGIRRRRLRKFTRQAEVLVAGEYAFKSIITDEYVLENITVFMDPKVERNTVYRLNGLKENSILLNVDFGVVSTNHTLVLDPNTNIKTMGTEATVLVRYGLYVNPLVKCDKYTV